HVRDRRHVLDHGAPIYDIDNNVVNPRDLAVHPVVDLDGNPIGRSSHHDEDLLTREDAQSSVLPEQHSFLRFHTDLKIYLSLPETHEPYAYESAGRNRLWISHARDGYVKLARRGGGVTYLDGETLGRYHRERRPS